MRSGASGISALHLLQGLLLKRRALLEGVLRLLPSLSAGHESLRLTVRKALARLGAASHRGSGIAYPLHLLQGLLLELRAFS